MPHFLVLYVLALGIASFSRELVRQAADMFFHTGYKPRLCTSSSVLRAGRIALVVNNDVHVGARCSDCNMGRSCSTPCSLKSTEAVDHT